MPLAFFPLWGSENLGDRLGIMAVPTLISARNSVNRELGFATVGAVVSSLLDLGELVGKVKNGEI